MKLKFENVDIEKCLRSVMERNTQHYQGDFEFDVKSFRHIAQSLFPERKPLYWLSRPSGTWCFQERNIFIRDSDAFHTWQFYKDTRDTILAYTVEITGMENNKVVGNLYTQDYRAVAEHIEKNAVPASSVLIQFENQHDTMKFDYEYYNAHRLSIHAQFGRAEKFRLEPKNPQQLKWFLQNERIYRQNFMPGVFENHLDKMIAAEKRSLIRYLKETAKSIPRPPSKCTVKEQTAR